MNNTPRPSFPNDLHADSLARQEWSAALMTCTDSQRLNRLRELATTPPYSNQMTDAAYWHTLRHLLFNHSDFARPTATLRRLLVETRPSSMRHLLMDADERVRLARQPERITLFQGFDVSTATSWLWCLSPRQAVWNAIRVSKGKPVVIEATVSKQSVLMLSASLPHGAVLVAPDDITRTRLHSNTQRWIASDALVQ
jgi:hypothetical protein